MTNERTQYIDNVLAQDPDKLKKLLEMSPEEASAVLHDEGIDITAEELVEFLNNIMASLKDGELNENDLDTVAGGCGGCVKDIVGAIWGVLSRHVW